VKPIAIFAATRWELNALRRALPIQDTAAVDDIHFLTGTCGHRTYWLIRTGVGSDAASRVAAAVFDAHRPALAVSAGFACALGRAEIGNLLLAETVASVRYDAGWTTQADAVTCDEAVRSEIMTAARGAGIEARSGIFVSAPLVLCRAQDKKSLSLATGALGLDMESAALGTSAAGKGVPFAVVRTVSDLVDEDLPLDFNVFLRPGGWARGAWSLAGNPSSLIGMNRLRKQSGVAAERLAGVFKAWLNEGIGQCRKG
jgi:adenosylhomocysteine nucleosidase